MQLPFKIDLTGKTAVVTGGGGVLCSCLAIALAECGAKVAVLSRKQEKADVVADEINRSGGKAIGISADVLVRDSLIAARERIISELGTCDILINGAGGNRPEGNTAKEYFFEEDIGNDKGTFFDLDIAAMQNIMDLNYLGTVLSTQIFAKDMLGKKDGTVINVSSMNYFRPLTKVPAYSGAKAAVSNFTQWLAVHFSKVGIRVNAIAPGFFSTQQNHDLLYQKDGTLTERSKKILNMTPLGRFGIEQELVGTLLWLVSKEASGFVTGIVVPVDGGFSAYSGV